MFVQDAAGGVAMNEEFRFVPKVMPKQLHISCRVLETSGGVGVGATGGWGGAGQAGSECALLGSGHTIVNASSLRSGGTLTMNIFAQPEVSDISQTVSHSSICFTLVITHLPQYSPPPRSIRENKTRHLAAFVFPTKFCQPGSPDQINHTKSWHHTNHTIFFYDLTMINLESYMIQCMVSPEP